MAKDTGEQRIKTPVTEAGFTLIPESSARRSISATVQRVWATLFGKHGSRLNPVFADSLGNVAIRPVADLREATITRSTAASPTGTVQVNITGGYDYLDLYVVGTYGYVIVTNNAGSPIATFAPDVFGVNDAGNANISCFRIWFTGAGFVFSGLGGNAATVYYTAYRFPSP